MYPDDGPTRAEAERDAYYDRLADTAREAAGRMVGLLPEAEAEAYGVLHALRTTADEDGRIDADTLDLDNVEALIATLDRHADALPSSAVESLDSLALRIRYGLSAAVNDVARSYPEPPSTQAAGNVGKLAAALNVIVAMDEPLDPQRLRDAEDTASGAMAEVDLLREQRGEARQAFRKVVDALNDVTRGATPLDVDRGPWGDVRRAMEALGAALGTDA